MSHDTERLIRELAADARPVRLLAPAWQRSLRWLLASVPPVVLLALAMGWRGTPPSDMASAAGAWSWWGSLCTGLLATYAVFQVSVPGRAAGWAWLPLPAVLAWFAGMGWASLAPPASHPIALPDVLQGWHCALAITVVSVPMLLAMLIVVRHAGVARPLPTALLAMLGATGLSSAVVSLRHGHEQALATLVCHGGAVLLLCAAAWLAGRPLLQWLGPARR